jgi:hypothetical protein
MSTALARSAVGKAVAATAAAAAVATLAAVTGCSSGSGGGADSGLLKQLGHMSVRAGGDQVTYLDGAQVRELAKGDPRRFTVVGRSGSALLTSYRPGPLGTKVKTDQIDAAVDTRKAGHWEGSFDEAAVTASLKSNGFTQHSQDGEQVWTRSGTGTFRISKDEITYSLGGTGLSVSDPEHDASLAGQKDYRRAADCLGDVYRADFNPLTAGKPVRLTAVGQQAASSSRTAGVFCAIVKDDTTADRVAAKFTSVIAAKPTHFAGAKVSTEHGDQPLVKVTVPDTADQRPGRLLYIDLDLWMTLSDF